MNAFDDKSSPPGTVTRRGLHQLLAAAGITSAVLPLLSQSAWADQQARLYIMGGYADKPLFADYVAKNGGSPDITLWADEEEALTKLRAGLANDLVYCGSYSVDRWRDAGVLQPIDLSRLTHWAEIYQGLKNIPGMVKGGQTWWVPIGFGTTSIVYRTDLVDFKEESWAVLWDERYKGRLAMYDNTADGVAAAALYAGVDAYTMDEVGIAKVKAAMVKQRPLLRMYTTDSTELAQAMAAGEIVAASAANDVYATLKKQGVPVGYMFAPKEGILTWAMGVSINKNASHLDKAYDLINSLTSSEAGVFWSTHYGFGHSNEKAYSTLTDAQLVAAGLPKDPKTMLKNGVFESRMKSETAVSTMLEQVKAGF